MGFDYTDNERILIAFFTGITNFSFLPVIFLMILQKRYFEVYLSIYTGITSFLYHVCEGLDYDIYMNQKKWHVCDNIGSITAINSILVYFMRFNNYEKEVKYNLFCLFLAITLQINEPWDLNNTILPIILYAALLGYHIYNFIDGHKVRYHPQMLKNGMILLLFAFIGFFYGLDEHTDYLRLYHCVWHIFIGISTFYLRQAVVYDEKERLYSYGEMYKSIVTFQFNKMYITHHDKKDK